MADLKAQLEIGADVSGVEVGISKAKRSINSLGVAVQDANSRGSKSIDRFVQGLQTQAATMGKSARETELYKLALKGASDAQLKAADSAIKLREGYERGALIGERVRAGFLAIGAAAATGLIAAAVAFDQLIKKAGNFQDLSEKYGDTSENFASLAVSAGTAGIAMDTVGSAAGKLTKNLTGVDDESKAAGAAVSALGLNLDEFKALGPVAQMEKVAKALSGFEDGAAKTAVAMALFGKSGADLLPFLKELGIEGGRQVILTQKQLDLSDEYSDKQAKLRAQISLHAQAIATDLLPAVNAFTQTIADLAKDQEFAATATAVLKGALSGAVVVFQTIAVVASEVGFVFLGVGREIGAMLAQLAALARLDFNGFRAISEAVKADADRARVELDRFQSRVMSIGNPVEKVESSTGDFARADRLNSRKKRLAFSGAVKGDKGGADAEAKAQLAFDLDQIKKSSAAITNAYSNAEKIMEAQRAAGLLDEREYYASKLGFLRLNAGEQERALQEEITRLERVKAIGKEKIDTERKIADLRAKIVKTQADATAAQIVLDIQEAAATRQKAAALLSARQAAEDYYDQIKKQQALEVASVGMSDRERNVSGGVSQIEERYAGQRRDLDNQRALLELEGKFTDDSRKQYEARLAIINEFQEKSVASFVSAAARKLEAENDWTNGAARALKNYYDETQKVSEQTDRVVTDVFKGLEDVLVKFAETGKLTFKDLVNSINAELLRIAIRQSITGPLAAAMGGGGGGGGLIGLAGSVLGAFGGTGAQVSVASAMPGNSLDNLLNLNRAFGTRASGGPVSAGGLYQVNEKGPELLEIGNRTMLMMGSQSGTVTPNSAIKSSSPTYVSVNVTPPPGSNPASAGQWGATAGRAIQRSLVRYT